MTEQDENEVPVIEPHQTMADVDPSMHRLPPEPSTAPAVAETGPTTSLGEEETANNEGSEGDDTTDTGYST